MTSRPKKISTFLGLRKLGLGMCIGVMVLLSPAAALAQEKIVFSVTPPLFQVNMARGEQWASQIKVINNNPDELHVYATVMNFQNNGEKGYGKFDPIIKTDPEHAPQLLAHWVNVSKESIVIPAESSATIPFSVDVPADAPPGGHYAAIMVGTQPFTESNQGMALGVSSMVTSLLMVRVEGEVVERGEIIDFYSEKSVYQKPEFDFAVRFENQGNVHLQPRGEIKITNMWGKEKGIIPVNQKTSFGNVLRNSIRRFEFSWALEGGILDAGRYTALASLTYGQDKVETVYKETVFWYLPAKPLMAWLGGIIAGLLLLIWGIRMFVKRLVARQARMLGLPVGGLPGKKLARQGAYITLPTNAYLRKSPVKTQTTSMSKKSTTKKTKNKKSKQEESAEDTQSGRLKGIAWLKKEYAAQNKLVAQQRKEEEKEKFSFNPKVLVSKLLSIFKKDDGGSEKKSSKKSKKTPSNKMATNDEGVFGKMGVLLSAKRQYVITVLLTAVIVSGVFGMVNYFSAKDTEPIVSEGEGALVVGNADTSADNKGSVAQENILVKDNIATSEKDEQEITSEGENNGLEASDEPEVVIAENTAEPELLPSDVRVAVFNGSGIPGLAGKYADLVTAEGFVVAEVGNADSFDYTVSEVLYLPAAESLVDRVSDVFSGTTQAVEQTDLEYDLIVIVGQSEG